MIWKKVIGIVIGAAVGFALGYFSRCAGGSGVS